MTQQFSVTLRNYWANGYENQIGASPKCRVYTGDQPASCAAAATGTQLGEGTWPSDWMNAASAGSVTKNGTLQITITVSGTIGHYRIYDNAGTTCHEQGKVGQALALALTADTAANSNVLTFSTTAGVTVGLSVSGSGLPSDAVVREATSTTVKISCAPSALVATGTLITFGSPGSTVDFRLANPVVTAGQVIDVPSKTLTMPGA